MPPPARDLEYRAAARSTDFFVGSREPFPNPGEKVQNAGAGDRRSEEDRNNGARRDLSPELGLDEGNAQLATGVIEFRDHALVRLGKEIDYRLLPGRVVAVARHDLRCSEADPGCSVHCHHAEFQLAAHLAQAAARRGHRVDRSC